MEKQTKTTAVAKINNTEILIIEADGEKRVAVKPICEALGVAFQSQLERLKNDPILNSTITLSVTVGADGKQREMVTIPYKFVFGWLFRIDSRNVKTESKEAVERYQLECYNVLYNHFTIYSEFVEYKQKLIEEKLEERKDRKSEFSEAKTNLKSVEDQIEEIRKMNLDDYKSYQAQQMIEFPAEQDNEKGGE